MVKLGQMMQQARRMQEQIQKMQTELAKIEATGEAGGGMVQATVSGDRIVRAVRIDDAAWAEHDRELIEDMVTAAVNAALRGVEEKAKEKQQEMLSGLPLPPGFSL